MHLNKFKDSFIKFWRFIFKINFGNFNIILALLSRASILDKSSKSHSIIGNNPLITMNVSIKFLSVEFPPLSLCLTWTLMALRAFLVVVVGGLVTVMESESKTELLSDPNADSPSCISACYVGDTKHQMLQHQHKNLTLTFSWGHICNFWVNFNKVVDGSQHNLVKVRCWTW